jgi:hypothetical protein
LTYELLGSPVPGLPYARAFGEEASPQPLGRWDVTFAEDDFSGAVPPFLTEAFVSNGQPRVRLRADAINDVWILCRYSASSP